MKVEVVHARVDAQAIVTVELREGATVADALAEVANRPPFSELDLARTAVGIHGVLAQPGTRLQPGDRVEIYRPLVTDPREARRRRAREPLRDSHDHPNGSKDR